MAKHKAQHYVKQMSPKYLPGNPKARPDDLRLVMNFMPNPQLTTILVLLLVAQGIAAIEAADCQVGTDTAQMLAKRCTVSSSTLTYIQSKTEKESCAYLINCSDTNGKAQYTRAVAPKGVAPGLGTYNKDGNIGFFSANPHTTVSKTLEYKEPCISISAPR